MKTSDLRIIVERMTDAPWFARGRFLSLVRDSSGMGATLHTNHVASFAEPYDTEAVAALRNHASAQLALQDAVAELRDWDRSEHYDSGNLDAIINNVLACLAAVEAVK